MSAPTVGTQIAERFMPGGDAATREHLRAAIDAALSVQADAAVLDAARDFEWFGRIEIQPGQRGLAQTHDKMRAALEVRPASGSDYRRGWADGVEALRAELAKGSAAEFVGRGEADPAAPGQTLYIDLDGVMADFDGAFPAVFGLDHRSLADEAMWLHINAHPSFFRDLPPMPGAIDFFRSVEHLHPVILTACPKSNYPHVAAQKRAWVREHLSETCLVLPVLGGRHKPLFMHQPGDILVDDWGKNCVAWTDAGGVAIKHEGDFIDTRAALSTALLGTGNSAPAAPSTGSILTGAMTGGAAETGAIVQDGGAFRAAFFVSKTGGRLEQLTSYRDYQIDGAELWLMDLGQKRASARGLTKKGRGSVSLAWVRFPELSSDAEGGTDG